jgi:UDP-glucose 4-epimerase
MKCLVTGGEGFIGSHVVDSLVARGHDVLCIDDRSAPENAQFYRSPRAKYVTSDIRERANRYLYRGIDVVFHMAARSRIQPSIANPTEWFSVNVMGTQEVLEACRASGVRRVVYSASSSYYGHASSPPFREDAPPGCATPYSLSKWQGEQICDLYTRLYGLSTVSLRYFNVYGPREPLRGGYAPVMGLFKRQAAAGQPITVDGDGMQRRDFTYITDVVEANILAAESAATGTYNIGTGKNTSILDLARRVSVKYSADIEFLPKRIGETQETLADASKAERDLGWKATTMLEDTLFTY